ncbi:MAG: Glucosyltransferase-like protein [Pleopsidium flavum]|nr:MAG: Glucosyltransferase-like protein [Pleopsidium flavum]
MTPGSSVHKSRRKKKAAVSSITGHGTITVDTKTNEQRPAFPLVAFFWPARKATSQWVVLPLTLMVVGLFRWSAGLWGYSGYQSPPMYGDFEAQRHWMELTNHIPMSQWYFHDLEWWGLDYPPLTAYHSWVLGKIGSFINPAWFALQTSRGMEDQLLKVFMRATVLISEYVTYIPAAAVYVRHSAHLEGVSTWESSIALSAVLMQPATILVDHTHFQYNTVMLGLVLASMSSILAGRPLWASVFFVAALGFKQMALYYAPAIFAYLLGICILPQVHIRRFFGIALATILSFTFMCAPLIFGALYDAHYGISPAHEAKGTTVSPLFSSLPFAVDRETWYYAVLLQLSQITHRIFPFARGLFEDKVANIWCAFHTVHKLHQYPTAMLQRLSLSATLISILPACMTISLFPRKELLPLALASTAWGFFLCSFQVHEKSVLLPLLPMTLLLTGKDGLGSEIRAWVGWANMLGSWTMFPLLKRDDLRVPYTVLTLLWAYMLGLPPTSLSLYFGRQTNHVGPGMVAKVVHLGFYAAMISWHALEAFVQTPEGKPDLWVVINVIIGAAGFGLCFLWCTWRLIQKAGVMQGYVVSIPTSEKGKKKVQ